MAADVFGGMDLVCGVGAGHLELGGLEVGAQLGQLGAFGVVVGVVDVAQGA
ncbi:Uncharacterised protein [Mycobacteroides abscessus subsp. abscessus]|nr:Uncharacterised protein [Mycobacteroides abscessus subsp. abscessus]